MSESAVTYNCEPVMKHHIDPGSPEDEQSPHGLTVIIGGYHTNTINNSVVIQAGQDFAELAEQIQKLDPQAFGQLLKAISVRIAQEEKTGDRTPNN